MCRRARLRGPTPLTVDVQSAETETDARERVRFYELCSPRMLGDWTDDRTCVVNVTGGMGALQGAGEELIRISKSPASSWKWIRSESACE